MSFNSENHTYIFEMLNHSSRYVLSAYMFKYLKAFHVKEVSMMLRGDSRNNDKF